MESNVYNLTNPQKSIWFTEQFYKGTPIENITGCVIVLEKLNLKALQIKEKRRLGRIKSS